MIDTPAAAGASVKAKLGLKCQELLRLLTEHRLFHSCMHRLCGEWTGLHSTRSNIMALTGAPQMFAGQDILSDKSSSLTLETEQLATPPVHPQSNQDGNTTVVVESTVHQHLPCPQSCPPPAAVFLCTASNFMAQGPEQAVQAQAAGDAS